MSSTTSDSSPLINVESRGRSIDEAVAFYERVYDSNDIHIERPAPDFEYRYRTVGDDQLTVGTSAVSARRWGTIVTNGRYYLAWSQQPGIALGTDGDDPIIMQPGVPVMYPVGESFRFDALPATQHLIRFDGDFLETVAAAHRASAPGPLQFDPHPTAESLEFLRRTIGTAAPKLLDASLDRGERTRLNLAVAEAVVDTYAATPLGQPVQHATVRAVQEYIAAHAGELVTMTEIAATLGVSARHIQLTFKRHVGVSPLEFLRQTRAHRVRARLIMESPETTTVRAEAIALGFGHVGRFSRYYADLFGEQPSETLRRRRPARSRAFR